MRHTFGWQAVLLAGSVAGFFAMGAGADESANIYRTGSPAVLAPEVKKDAAPAEVPSMAVREAFRRFYQQAGSPRLAVFWNRSLDDQLQEMEADSRVVVSRTTARRSDDGGTLSTNTSENETSVSVETRKNARTSPLSVTAGWRFRSGFLGPFVEEGAKMIDRDLIMRLTAASRGLDRPFRPVRDRQLIEMLALKDHADLLIQIVLESAGESKSGALFHVSVIDIKKGQILGSFVHDATFAKETRGSRKWKAIRGGFVEVEHAESPKADLERMGRVLASQAMVVLSRT